MVPIVNQTDPPIPHIASLDQHGYMVVEFSKMMIPPRNVSNVTNGTVWINETEYPALGIQVFSSDPDLTPQEALNFTWECLNFTGKYMIIQVNFTNTSQVSITLPLDTIKLTFWD